MNSSLLIVASTAFVMFCLIFGRKAPGIFLGVLATLSFAWIAATILSA